MSQRNNRRFARKKPKRQLGWIIKLLVGLLVLAGLLALAGYAWVSFSHQPIRQVAVSSDGSALQVDKLRALVKHDVTGDFFTLNTGQLRAHLALLPWVKSVSIRRVWPDKLRVSIHERQAVALWNKAQLLSEEGTLFRPVLNSYPRGLPRLTGGDNQEKKALKIYQTLSQKMHSLGLQVVALNLVGHSWEFQLDSGAQVYFNEGEEWQLQGFKKLYQQVLRNKMQRVEQVDLRYEGGASVRWKTRVKKKYEQ